MPVCDAVWLLLAVPVCDPVPLGVPVALGEPVPVPVGVCDGLLVRLPVLVPVADTDAVSDTDAEGLLLDVGSGVALGVDDSV